MYSRDTTKSSEETSARPLRTRDEVVQDILRATEAAALPPVEEEEDEIRLLAQALRNRRGSFGLHFAVCDDSARQHELTHKIASMLPEQQIVEVELNGEETSLLDALRTVSGAPDPLVVYGLERLLPQGNNLSEQLRRQDTLQEMQMRREQFRSLGRPLMLWMPEYVYTLIGQQAVDFWSWQGGAAFFATAAPTPYFSASGTSVQLPQFSERDTLRGVQQGFVGRQDEIQSISASLRAGQSVVIYGLPGIGKTDLALTIADHLSGEFPDARLYVPLRGTTDKPENPSSAMRMVIQAFAPSAKLPDSHAYNDLLPIYQTLLVGKRALIVLDDPADDIAVALFLPPEGSVLLVAARGDLSQPGMMKYQLGSLAEGDAHSLLRAFAPRIKANEAQQLAVLCNYMPLALRLVGGRLAQDKQLTVLSYVSELRASGLRNIATSYESLEVFLKRSHAALEPEAANLFRQLAVFSSEFESEAEELICEDPKNKILLSLVQRSLVNYDEVSNQYHMVDLLHQFASSLISAEERKIGTYKAVMYYASRITGNEYSELLTSPETFWSFVESIVQPLVLNYAARLFPSSGEESRDDLISTLRARVYTEISEAITTARIDPSPNLIEGLRAIALHSLRRYFRDQRALSRNNQVSFVDEYPLVVDPESEDFEDQIIEADYRQKIVKAVLDFWKESLPVTDYAIMQMRYLSDSPLPYDLIARQLGSGWTEVAVRVRVSRVLNKTRAYLIGLGIGPS